MTVEDFEYVSKIAREVVLLLEQNSMKAAIGGAVAYGFWGPVRSTNDVDVNVFIGESRYSELQTVIEKAGLGPGPGRAAWTADDRARFVAACRDGAVAIAYHGDFRVDFFVPSIPFYDEAERTVRRIAHPSGQTIPVLSPEALCVFKLLFFRPKDLVDLAGLVARRRATLDATYVRHQLEIMFPGGDERIDAWDRIVREHGSRG